MKVVFLITRLDYSGGPKMMAWVANQFAISGHEVYFIAVYSDQIEQPLEPTISFVPLNLLQSKNRSVRITTENIKVQFGVREKINNIRPDLIIGFLYPVDLFFTLFNQFSKGYKVILSQRLDPFSEKGMTAWIKKRIVSMADGIVFQTQGARNFYGRNVQKRGIVIPNPVTDRTLRYSEYVKPFAHRKNIVVLPARLDIQQKRQDLIIAAFELVLKKYPEMRLVLLGNGPDREELLNMISKKGLCGKAEVHSAVPTAEEFTKDCKIVCLTSDFEGVPNSLLEAMALGLNVVATDCRPGGARMLIEDGKNGYLVERGDWVALASKICLLLGDHENADRIARKAKDVANQYSEINIRNMWISYVDHIVKKQTLLKICYK